MGSYSVRIPKELADRIDEQINKKNFFTTRPDFILYAMRSTVELMADKYVQVKNIVSTNENLSALEGQVDTMISGIGRELLRKYEDYEGDSVQILIRIPDGLNEYIGHFIWKIGLARSTIDFIRISIICCLESMDRVEQVAKDVDKYIEESRRSQYRLVQEVTNSILNGGQIDVYNIAVNHAFKSEKKDEE